MKQVRLLAAIIAATVTAMPALADRELKGNEAHQILAGQQFSFHCIDGTRGEASYALSGVAMASYRLPSTGEDAKEVKDHGRVRTTSEALCIRWTNLNGGQEACFRVTERRPGRYRISMEEKIGWCDITVRGAEARAERD